jgi:hypothetical protein
MFVPTRIESAPIRESDGVEEALGEGQSAGEGNRGVAGAKEGRRKHRFQGSLGSRAWDTLKYLRLSATPENRRVTMRHNRRNRSFG